MAICQTSLDKIMMPCKSTPALPSERQRGKKKGATFAACHFKPQFKLQKNSCPHVVKRQHIVSWSNY